jgi:hypothetical protein
MMQIEGDKRNCLVMMVIGFPFLFMILQAKEIRRLADNMVQLGKEVCNNLVI